MRCALAPSPREGLEFVDKGAEDPRPRRGRIAALAGPRRPKPRLRGSIEIRNDFNVKEGDGHLLIYADLERDRGRHSGVRFNDG